MLLIFSFFVNNDNTCPEKKAIKDIEQRSYSTIPFEEGVFTMQKITLTDIDDIALGASLLGAGGGGDPYIGKLMVMSAIKEFGPVTLLDPKEIDDDALILPIGMMGAPSVLSEKGIGTTEIQDLYDMAVKQYGRAPDAFMCTEAGGVNSMMPLCAGSRLGIPVVDADGMGRAFPELQMETMTIGGIKASPVCLADEKGNKVVFDTIDNKWTEELARACTVRCGGNVCVCMYAMNGISFKKYSVPHTISRCKKLGHLIKNIKQNTNKEQIFCKASNATPLFSGKITDVLREINGAFNKGKVKLTGTGNYKDQQAEVTFQNENLSASINGHLKATVPDLICMVDSETYYPVTTDLLKYGKRILLIGIPCHPLWRTTIGLELVGPRYFGIDTDYIPVESHT